MGRLDPAQVRDIEVETCERSMRLARSSAGNPLSARFSLPYAVAAAAIFGRASQEVFLPDDAVAELASRVIVRSSPAMSARWPEALPARVTVNLLTGTRLQRHVDNPRGHFTNRPDPEAVRQKFLQLSWAQRAPELHTRLLGIAQEENVFGLFVETSGRTRAPKPRPQG